MAISVSSFGITKKGKASRLYTITNKNGVRAMVSDFGANLVSLYLPDRNGFFNDVVLGFDDVRAYEFNPSYFGSTIGRNANRIGKSVFVLDGKKYNIEVNDGPNNLHSSFDGGYNKRFFKPSVNRKNNSVTFSLRSKNGDQGFPGNLEMTVTYRLTDDNELFIEYTGQSDADTVFNPTNHTYFNLGGHASGDILHNELMLNCKKLTAVGKGSIPTGEIIDVKGTPYDFTKFRVIGERIKEDNELLKIGKGYDINYVIDKKIGEYALVGELRDPESGRTVTAYTDMPGVQLYTGNCIATQVGKGGFTYRKRNAVCLETQFYPDAINNKAFPSPILAKGKTFKSVTCYKFGTY